MDQHKSYDIDAEQSVVGAILIDDSVLAKFADSLEPEHFFDSKNGVIYKAARYLYRKNQPVDLVTLTAALKSRKVLEDIGGSAYLVELTNNVPTATNADKYAAIVSDLALRREIVKASAEISESGIDGSKSIHEVVEAARDKLEKIGKRDIVEKYQVASMSDYTDEAVERFKNWGKVQGISSGFKSVDRLTKGFVGGEMIIVAGKTSYGKTTLAMNVVNRMALEGKKILFVTLEMTHAELTSRFMYINGGNNLQFNEVAINVLFQKNDELNWNDIDGLIQKARDELQVDMVVIDHLHYFTRELENVAEDLGRISKEIKKNAIRHNIPIILISHVRKTFNNEVATMDDLRGSSYIAQDADIVLMVGRDPDTGEMIVKIEKNRNRGFDARDDNDMVTLGFEETKLTEPEDFFQSNEYQSVNEVFPGATPVNPRSV